MIIDRIKPLSLARVTGGMFFIGGFLWAATFVIMAWTGRGPDSVLNRPAEGAIVTVGALVVLPLGSFAVGAAEGLLLAMLYNLASRVLGGVELVLRPRPQRVELDAAPVGTRDAEK